MCWRCPDISCPGRAVTDVHDQLVSCNENHSYLQNVTETVVELIKEDADFKLYIHHVIAGSRRASKKKKKVQKPREQTENY